jgi:hypothetical protein
LVSTTIAAGADFSYTTTHETVRQPLLRTPDGNHHGIERLLDQLISDSIFAIPTGYQKVDAK